MYATPSLNINLSLLSEEARIFVSWFEGNTINEVLKNRRKDLKDQPEFLSTAAMGSELKRRHPRAGRSGAWINLMENGHADINVLKGPVLVDLLRLYRLNDDEVIQLSERFTLDIGGMAFPASLESGPPERPTPGDRLRKLREERGLEREYVADHSEGAISARRLTNLEEKPGMWERVKTEETHALAFVYEMKLSDFLETVNGTKFPGRPNIYTDEAVLAHPDLTHGVRYVPIYNMAGMGPGGDDGDIIGYADIPSEWNGDHAGYKVFGDSMSPEIRDGAVVIVKKQDRAAPGNDIICWTPDDGMLCKHLDKIEDGYHVLTSVNIDYKPIWTRAIKIYGIIVQSRNPHKVVNGIH